MPRPIVLALFALALVALSATDARGQDVEMLAARYGTRPPAAYYRELARNPDAFRFRRGRASRVLPTGASRAAGATGIDGGAAAGPMGTLGPRDGPVVGDFTIPVVLGLFDDSPSSGPYSAGAIHDAYFADLPGTVRAYYDEVSGGRVALDAEVQTWARVDLTRAEVTRGDGALSSAALGQGGIGNYVFQVVSRVFSANPALDWGMFDNDGPDGVPNSGDDDGFVDALAVMHPTSGAECDGAVSRVWSHKWNLSQALRGETVATPSARTGGGVIRIDDYFVLPVLSCDGGALNEIGIFTHEVGHAFGLPDLYDVRYQHAGVGTWDLMASGAWGCDDDTPERPCHMGAWSKAMLGWVEVISLDPGMDHGTLVLPAVETGGPVFRVDAQDGSGEYFLLENRQPVLGSYDQDLHGGGGLLVWQVDPVRVSARWSANTVNGSDQPGVRLRQADGRGDLLRSGGGRGDAGDPFPGSTGNVAFHAGSDPAAESYEGTATGITIRNIQASSLAGADASFDLTTRLTRVTLVADGSAGTERIFSVNGASPQPSGGTFDAVPFSRSRVEAAAGEVLEPGVRRPFRGWVGGEPSRVRTLDVPLTDTTLNALYSGREIQLGVTLESDAGAVVPGVVASAPGSPDLWFVEGQDVEVRVEPRTGFSFTAWTGDLEGASNPTFVTMMEPVFAGASLTSIYAVPDATFEARAAAAQSLTLQASNANLPVAWSVVSGALPEGMSLRNAGRLEGTPLETGQFTVAVRARDAIGLVAEGQVVVDVGPAEITPSRAVTPFILGGSLTEAEAAVLDRNGNGDGRYDLGDFRAWVRQLREGGQ